jgi:hypothetical protein
LIITLGFIVLITVVVIGFLASMRIERISSRSHLNGIRADVFAQEGVDTVVARLYSATSKTNVGWVSEAGMIFCHTNGSAVVPAGLALYSGSTTNTTSDVAVDLNPVSLETNQTLVTGSTSTQPLYVSWIYQRQDGTTSTNVPSYDAANPVVGRYAFWTDDESSKLNVNTAGLRNNTNALSDPSSVNLNALIPDPYDVSTNDISSITSFTATNNFNSASELVRASPTLDALYASQKFSLTHYNHSPELNMFGQPRIMLTTSTNTAWAGGSTNFIDILTTPNSDPGLLSSLDGTKVLKVIQTITNYMARTDWPILPGHSFIEKYPDPMIAPTVDKGSGGGVVQIAVNIIDYVRCAESTNILVQPLSISSLSGGYAPYNKFHPTQKLPDLNDELMDDVTMLGNTRRVCIVEEGAYCSADPLTTNGFVVGVTPVTMYAFARLYLPPNFGVDSVSYDQIEWDPVIEGSVSNNNFASDPGIISTNDVYPASSGPLNNGRYVTLKRTIPNVLWDINYAYRSSIYDLNGGLMNRVMAYGYVPTYVPNSQLSTKAAGIEKSLPSASCDDPCVNAVGASQGKLASARPSDMVTNNGNTFGTQSPTLSSTLAPPLGNGGTTPNVAQQQDTTSGGLGGTHTSDSIRLPYPKNDPKGRGPGRVMSLGELGYIHTGMDVWPNGCAGTPWRTLRLQPTTASDRYIPDWALLDLFCVPVVPGTRSEPFLMPHSTNNAPIAATPNVGGRVNLNSGIQPFSGSGLTRNLPLEAALLGATNTFSTNVPPIPMATVSTTAATTLSANIVNYHLGVAGGVASGGRTFSVNSAHEVPFFTPGQLSEVKGIADGGEDSEELVRQLLAVTTVRGNVFSIYTVGQSITQDASGAITELGEKRYQVMVERVGYGPNTVYQPIYMKTIMP